MDKTSLKILVTGVAGFIGFHMAHRALLEGVMVHGWDSINDYYDVQLKFDRLRKLGIEVDNPSDGDELRSTRFKNFFFTKVDVSDYDLVTQLMFQHQFDVVIHFAAQAGVRYGLVNPRAYLKNNVDGFLSILEGARGSKVKHLLFSSSSSVYGLNSELPYSERDGVGHPKTIYAVTKRTNELMAHSYAHLYSLPVTGLRFFTVYGPWGRPDMAPILFANAILNRKPIDVFNYGNMVRDFTFITDVIDAIWQLIFCVPERAVNGENNVWDQSMSSAPYRILNIGNSNPIELKTFISEMEKVIGLTAKVNLVSFQSGDVQATHADVGKLNGLLKDRIRTSLPKGLAEFIAWHKVYYN